MESLTLEEKARIQLEKDLEEHKINDLVNILNDIEILKIKYNRWMEELVEKMEKAKVRTAKWFDYDEYKESQKRRECCECENTCCR